MPRRNTPPPTYPRIDVCHVQIVQKRILHFSRRPSISHIMPKMQRSLQYPFPYFFARLCKEAVQ